MLEMKLLKIYQARRFQIGDLTMDCLATLQASLQGLLLVETEVEQLELSMTKRGAAETYLEPGDLDEATMLERVVKLVWQGLK